VNNASNAPAAYADRLARALLQTSGRVRR